MLRYILEHKVSIISILLILLSISVVSIVKLPTALFPEIEYPAFEVVIKTAPNTTEFVEQMVASTFLKAFQDIDQLLYIRKIVSSDYCVLILKFEWNVDMDVAYLKIKESINRVEAENKHISDLLEDIQIKWTGGANSPFMAFILPHTSKDFVKEELVFKLGSIEGIGRVEIVGAELTHYKLSYPRENLYKYGHSAIDRFLYDYKILKNPINLLIKKGNFEYPLIVPSPIKSFDDLKMLPFNGKPLQKFFQVVEEHPSEEVIYNNRRYIAIFLYPSASGSPLQASKRVRSVLETSNLEYKILFDNSYFLKQTIRSLVFVLIYGILLAILSSLLFLGDAKVGFIVGISIPLSILFTFIFIYLAGYSLNIITLGALIMSSGMLIDASIIVLESIQEASRKYDNYTKAVILGTQSIRGAVISSMLTNCVVFIPVVFIYGLAGKLFFPFSMVVIVSTFFALFISLTIVPMFADIFKIQDKSTELIEISASFFKKSFLFVNRHGKLVGVAFLFFFILFVYSLSKVRFTMFPDIRSPNLQVKIYDFSGLESRLINSKTRSLLENNKGVVVIQDEGIKTWTLYLFNIKDHRRITEQIRKMFSDVVIQISDLDNPLSFISREFPSVNETRYAKVKKLKIMPEKVLAYDVSISDVFATLKSALGHHRLGAVDTVEITLCGFTPEDFDEILNLPIENRNRGKILLRRLVSVEVDTFKVVQTSLWPSSDVPIYEKNRTQSSVFQAILFAGVLVFLAIVAVFESAQIAGIAVWQIPLSLAFIIVLFTIFNKSIDVITGIGIIVLAGISVNDAIVLLDFITKNMNPQKEARILNAIEKRTRSIVITTITTVMGLIPLLLSRSPGAKIQHGIAIVLILGILFSTLTSMTIIPKLYLIITHFYDKHR